MQQSKRLWTVCVMAVCGLVGVVTGPSVGATTQTVQSDLTASLVVTGSDATVTTLPSSTATFTGAYDDATGELTGSTLILGDHANLAGTPLGDTEALFSFLTGDEITNGHIAADGSVSFDDELSIGVFEIGPLQMPTMLPDGCTFGPVDVHYTGTYDSATDRVDVSSDAFTVSPIAAGACGEATDAFNAWLGDASLTMNLQFRLVAERSTPEPTVPTGGALSTIKANGIVSSGCEVTVPISFGEGGRYTLEAVTVDHSVIESITIVRNAAGPYNARMTIDAPPGTNVGTSIRFVLRDATGVQVADAVAPVRDPRACLGPTPIAQPAAAVTARPAFTG